MEKIGMEKTYDALVQYIREKLPDVHSGAESEDTPLPMPEKIIFGVADVSRYEQKILVTVTPQSMEEEDGTSADSGQAQKFVVGVICRGQKYDVLVRQMCRYAECIVQILRSGWSLGGNVSDLTVIRTDFYSDAGTVEKQATVAEIEISIKTSGRVTQEVDPFEN